MDIQEFNARVAKIVKAYGISSSMACEAQENCDDFEMGTPEWFECFEASIESLLDDEE